MVDDTKDSLATELLEVQRTLGWMDLVIGSIDDAVYVTDTEARVVFVNHYFSELLNIPRVFLLGQHISDVFDITFNDKLTAEAVSNNTHANDDVGIYTWSVQDQKRIFQISKRYITTTKQTVHLAKDITHEQELAAMKNSFINIASHQLRTPMTSIMLHAHMLKDLHANNDDPRTKDIATTLARSSERMIRLISDILNITKIQNSPLAAANAKPVDINDIFMTVYEDIKNDIVAKDLNFSSKVKEPFSQFNSDAGAIHEIIANLVNNAIQYTPQSGSITLTATRTKTEVVISITDTGIGIPQESINTIYEQFTRADNAFEVFNEGTGLGLYLVRLLLLKLGGTIECRSKLGRGTTFVVHLPIG